MFPSVFVTVLAPKLPIGGRGILLPTRSRLGGTGGSFITSISELAFTSQFSDLFLTCSTFSYKGMSFVWALSKFKVSNESTTCLSCVSLNMLEPSVSCTVRGLGDEVLFVSSRTVFSSSRTFIVCSSRLSKGSSSFSNKVTSNALALVSLALAFTLLFWSETLVWLIGVGLRISFDMLAKSGLGTWTFAKYGLIGAAVGRGGGRGRRSLVFS